MEDSTSAPAARGGLPAPPTAATRLASAIYHREQDWRLRINSMDDTRAPSSTFPISAPAPRSSSGGARPPLPSLAPPATKKKRPLFVAPHPRRQQAPSPGDVRCTASGIPSAAAWDASFTASASSVGYIDGEFSPTRQPIFDWTRRPRTLLSSLASSFEISEMQQCCQCRLYLFTDPRPSSSQPFMNLLTQDKDSDLQILMQEDATPSKRPPKRGSNYSLEEDIQLCKSWINISNDAVVGTDQPGTDQPDICDRDHPEYPVARCGARAVIHETSSCASFSSSPHGDRQGSRCRQHQNRPLPLHPKVDGRYFQDLTSAIGTK
ncbi:hypothetical protein EJB05_37137, partial [Eragrostis curvula]